jgi:DNA-binding transcriptional LysR family regulator
VNEAIDNKLKRAAVSLSETLDYGDAARSLKISVEELKAQVSRLEDQLCVRIFEQGVSGPRLTKEGHVLIEVFRQCKRTQ